MQVLWLNQLSSNEVTINIDSIVHLLVASSSLPLGDEHRSSSQLSASQSCKAPCIGLRITRVKLALYIQILTSI